MKLKRGKIVLRERFGNVTAIEIIKTTTKDYFNDLDEGRVVIIGCEYRKYVTELQRKFLTSVEGNLIGRRPTLEYVYQKDIIAIVTKKQFYKLTNEKIKSLLMKKKKRQGKTKKQKLLDKIEEIFKLKRLKERIKK